MSMRAFLLLILLLLISDLAVGQSLSTCIGAKVSRDLDSNVTPQAAKSGRTMLCGYYFENSAASKRYLKFYNKATAPTVGTDPPVMTLPLPAGAAGHIAFPGGIDEFPLGLHFASTTGKADNDTAAPAAGEVTAIVVYR